MEGMLSIKENLSSARVGISKHETLPQAFQNVQPVFLFVSVIPIGYQQRYHGKKERKVKFFWCFMQLPLNQACPK